MAVYITGDTHRHFQRIVDFIKKYELGSGDTIVVLGDVGLNFFGNSNPKNTRSDLWMKSMLHSQLNEVTLFCVRGNHDLRPEKVSGMKLGKYWGGFVYEERQFPLFKYAMDGEYYNIQINESTTYTALVAGGAYSVDKQYRLKNGFVWEPDEQLSYIERSRILHNLDRYIPDLVFSHTVPINYEPADWFLDFIDQTTVDKTMEEFLQKVYDKVRLDIKHWYCGHYHGNRTIKHITFLFEDFVRLKPEPEPEYIVPRGTSRIPTFIRKFHPHDYISMGGENNGQETSYTHQAQTQTKNYTVQA